MPSFETENQVILHDFQSSQWLRFSNPHRIIAAHNIAEVIPSLMEMESLMYEREWYAAGFITYEASAAFDPALFTHRKGDLPLLWFGLFSKPQQIQFPKPDIQPYILGVPIPSINRDEYIRAISKIKEYIRSGDTYQVNYTMQLHAHFAGDPWNLFLAMVYAQGAGYSAWIDTGDVALCSSSPELFFRLEGSLLTCKPMKGTVKRGRTLAEDESCAQWLQNSEKNRAENVMIVDMIRNDLGRVSKPGSVVTTRLFDLERRPTLWQMTSTVTADCSASLKEILTALFPCASITGAPKCRTTEIIAELEPLPRGVYTGCIGYMTPDRIAQFNVAIRTAVVDKTRNRAEYGAGGGIVWDSEAEDEYEEALLKARVFQSRQQEFSLLETILWDPAESFFLLDEHLKRLVDSAEYFFNYPVNIQQILDLLKLKAAEFSSTPQKVRLLLSRSGVVQIENAPLDAAKINQRVRVRMAREPIDPSNPFLYHKTTRREIYEAALHAFSGCDDVLLWNNRGELTESSIANLVVELDGKLFTPPVDSGLLPGVFRASLIQQGKIFERIIKIEDLKSCSKIYLINSVRKWREAIIVNNSEIF
jgi:para-aminobenzoate synthetase/4-amino-4-deoxychorismate lyase